MVEIDPVNALAEERGFHQDLFLGPRYCCKTMLSIKLIVSIVASSICTRMKYVKHILAFPLLKYCVAKDLKLPWDYNGILAST